MKETIAFFDSDNISALDAKGLAQWIAFGPMVFQAARVLRNTGILTIVENAGYAGISLEDITSKTSLKEYGARVLLESGLSIGLVRVDEDGLYRITKTGYFLLHDDLTRVNMDFVHDVCYKAMFSLDKSIESGQPAGLSLFGNWNTIYEGLADLPAQVQKSWFAFDHFFSDDGFNKVLNIVLAGPVKTLVDIGGNTGRFSILCARYSPRVHVTILDLPGQLEMAKKEIERAGVNDRVSLYPADILDDDTVVPDHPDAIWMSQFLDCFSEDQICHILRKCHDAMGEESKLFIMEPFWDRQKFKTAAFCLNQTSLYFTALANGNSQMYASAVFKECLEKSGFSITEQLDGIGISQTLLVCKKS